MDTIVTEEKLLKINWVKTGQYFFAVALMAFGIIQFITGEFAPGRAPAWPVSFQGRLFFAYCTGTLMIISGIGVVVRHRSAHIVLVMTAAIIFAWALVRHIPIVALDLKWGRELTNAGKALVMGGGTFAIAATLPILHDNTPRKARGIIRGSATLIYVGRICLSIFMIIGGIEHFIFLEFVAQLVPSWIPGKIFWACFTGIALIAGGVGLLVNRLVFLASLLSGIMIVIWFLVLHLPRAFVFMDNNEWIAVCESLAFSGIAFVVGASTKTSNDR